jgi:hypothetical protein
MHKSCQLPPSAFEICFEEPANPLREQHLRHLKARIGVASMLCKRVLDGWSVRYRRSGDRGWYQDCFLAFVTTNFQLLELLDPFERPIEQPVRGTAPVQICRPAAREVAYAVSPRPCRGHLSEVNR